MEKGSELMRVLNLDSNGNALNDIAGLNGEDAHESNGSQVLDVLFGGKRDRVENAVSQASGLSSDQSGLLIKMLGADRHGGIDSKGRRIRW